MKKLITFRTLKSICAFEYPNLIGKSECEHPDFEESVICASRNCPEWKKLKEVNYDLP